MKKHFISFLGIILSLTSHAQQILVFSRDEICYPETESSQCNPPGIDEQFFKNYFTSATLKESMKGTNERLITPPLEWGEKVSDSTFGQIEYYTSFPYGFVTNLKLCNLLPEHTYLLTLNGNPELPGNDLLPDTVPNFSIEKYYDFLSVKTGKNGEYEARIGVFLKKGDYHVRIYVKDTSGYKIVLYHDYFKFSVN